MSLRGGLHTRQVGAANGDPVQNSRLLAAQ
jgi:hypothetical protein